MPRFKQSTREETITAVLDACDGAEGVVDDGSARVSWVHEDGMSYARAASYDRARVPPCEVQRENGHVDAGSVESADASSG